MKYYYLLILSFSHILTFGQTKEKIEIRIKPVTERVYVNERIEFQSFLVNNTPTHYLVPAREITDFSASFVDLDYRLYGPDEQEIKFKRAPRGNGSSLSPLSSVLAPNGQSTKIPSFFHQFTQTGTYKLSAKYLINAANKPANYTGAYISFEAYTEFVFEVIERGPIALERKEMDYPTIRKMAELTDLSKTNDSTNVFKVKSLKTSEQTLADLAKFKNIKSLNIGTGNIREIPEAFFELDLYELILSLGVDESATIDLRSLAKFKNLRSLKIYAKCGLIMLEDYDVFPLLHTLEFIALKAPLVIKSLPKEELVILTFENIASLEMPVDFSDFKKFQKLDFENVQNYTLPAKFSGSIKTLNLRHHPFDVIPDLSGLSLNSLDITKYTGDTLPETLQAGLKKGARIYFPETMANSKEYKKYKRAGFNVSHY